MDFWCSARLWCGLWGDYLRLAGGRSVESVREIPDGSFESFQVPVALPGNFDCVEGLAATLVCATIYAVGGFGIGLGLDDFGLLGIFSVLGVGGADWTHHGGLLTML